jgi:cyclic beta-1,2-glucan synthetase
VRDWENHPDARWSSEAAAARWAELRAELVAPVSLVRLAGRTNELAAQLSALEGETPAADGLRLIAAALKRSSAARLLRKLRAMIERALALDSAMDFHPLYKADRHLYAIGLDLTHERLDGACYDLLASEASLTSYLLVARGDAPRRHWFQLGRAYTRAAGRIGLVSWGGTMFEYMMPRLLLRTLRGTLLAEACGTAVVRQIEYGRQKGVPWGISESGFNEKYADGDYQYQAFGVPGLGLKRGLDQDLVIAPYATALAAMLAPGKAAENFRRLSEEAAEGRYGYYEAVDFTPERVPKGRKSAVVRSYMAHHQGMSLVALANVVLDEPMPRRFHADPTVKAAELLLQERIQRDAPLVETTESETGPAAESRIEGGRALLSRRLTTPFTPAPRTHLLSNSQYHVMITNSGSGFSTCRGLDVTRWREDPTREACGQFLYIRDLDGGRVWSAGHEPVCRPADEYEVVFAVDKVSLRRRDGDVQTLLEVTVSPEQLAEVRRVSLTNDGPSPLRLELTSYVELALAPHTADLAHPAFGKLFLETEWSAHSEALFCRRRPRSVDEQPLWVVHVSSVDGAAVGSAALGDVEHETDRARFLGRGRTLARPSALDPGATLSGTTGPVLDPALCLRRTVRLDAGGSAVVAFTTAVADSREGALAVADQFREPSAVARAFDLAWAQSQAEHQLRSGSPKDAPLFQRLGSHLLYAGSALRADPEVLAANRQGQAALWRQGISGDRPILLVSLAGPGAMPLARQLLDAHSYLRQKGLPVDLVLLDLEPAGYMEPLYQELQAAIRASGAADVYDQPGGIFVRKADSMPEPDRAALQSSARVVLAGDRGALADQLERVERMPPLPALLSVSQRAPSRPDTPLSLPPDLLFFNGLGGFTADGWEYCLLVQGPLRDDVARNGKNPAEPAPGPVLPPAPWVNVVANHSFGFIVSESGAGATWAGNSQTNRLTPWSNDPIADPHGEAIFLRDETTRAVWCPTPLPIPSEMPAIVRHGQGYTTFEKNAHGLEHELTVFVAPDDPIKLFRLRMRNPDSHPRRLAVTFYAELVLGTTRDATAQHVVTELDSETGALLARNAFRMGFGGSVAFADVDRRPRTVTADRAEFLGRHGGLEAPAALKRVELSGRLGAALDPCAAIQTKLELGPGEGQEVVFLLGEAENLDAARDLIRSHRETGCAARVLEDVKARWDSVLGAVQVHTPDPAMDVLLNRWLLYQVSSCRVWGRCAFYQSSGAYGFRDQLQDVMALCHAAPDEARTHILRASARQFLEGDVQHWWHTPAGQGVRTRSSDDLLWLPFVACHYATVTGDSGIFDERTPYLKGPLLKPGQDDDYGLPETTTEHATLYDHCARALAYASRFGSHGLPLMGSGDWNDGMNRVGREGRGESVWVGWFLVATLQQFAEVATARGDHEHATRCRETAGSLRAAIEKHAWDGNWYRRAYFDDGRPLGTVRDDECAIDSIVQTWAVISGAGDPERAVQAMAAVDERLVDREHGLILLFAPPFDAGPLEPGYINGYPPGVRENGGQYTHAAAWVVQATAMLGQGGRAAELFRLLSPIERARNPEAVARFKLEPYAVAADVYSRPPWAGRGGWTWYTGSAAWLYRVGLETLLGFQRAGDGLVIDPRIPAGWPQFEIVYRHRTATYRITVENPRGVERGVASVTLDDTPLPPAAPIPLADDGRPHEVRIVLGGV